MGVEPEGPSYAIRAEPLSVASASWAPAFAFAFTAATSAGVVELGMTVFAAASAFVEKGQKAFARLGRKADAAATTAKPARRIATWRSGLYVFRRVLWGTSSESCGGC